MTAFRSSAARLLGVALLAVTSLGACTSDVANDNSGSSNAAPGTVQPATAARDLHALPAAASWRGTIPCADCAGISTTLTLYPEGTYRREGAYLGTNGGGDTIAAEFGAWTYDHASRRLRLAGSMEAPALLAHHDNGALRMLDLRGDSIDSNLNYSLSALAEPVVLTHPARIAGAFTYLADAAILVECRSGLQFPVDMSAGFLTLQKAYADAGGNGQPRVVRLSAHLDNRPAMEGSGTVVALVIDSLHGVTADDGCAALRTQDSLANATWRLIALRGADAAALPVGANSEAGFRWDSSQNQLSGSGGCNRFSARGVLRGTTLVGTAVASTKRLCNAAGVMEIEQRLFELLSTDLSLRLQSDTLVWNQGPREVARFVRDDAGTAG